MVLGWGFGGWRLGGWGMYGDGERDDVTGWTNERNSIKRKAKSS